MAAGIALRIDTGHKAAHAIPIPMARKRQPNAVVRVSLYVRPYDGTAQRTVFLLEFHYCFGGREAYNTCKRYLKKKYERTISVAKIIFWFVVGGCLLFCSFEVSRRFSVNLIFV